MVIIFALLVVLVTLLVITITNRSDINIAIPGRMNIILYTDVICYANISLCSSFRHICFAINMVILF